jgi:1,4-dihydroxy-2-naphthoate octaprenyltransferase/chlorophyll synthase
MLKIWWTAVRPAAAIKVILPTLVGLAVGFGQDQVVRPASIGLALLFAWLDQIVIILLNDYADAPADSRHTERYPALIDKRAVPHAWLKRRSLLLAGLVSAALLVGVTFVLALSFDRPHAPWLGLAALFLLFAYSFWPIRLNYRGMGELLEIAGVGGVLPVSGYYIYTGRLDLPLLWLSPLLFLALSSAVASGLKHLPADRENGKKTVAVLFGDRLGRAVILAGLALAVASAAALTWQGRLNPYSAALTVVVPGLFGVMSLKHLKEATFENLRALKKFKGALGGALLTAHMGLALGFATA